MINRKRFKKFAFIVAFVIYFTYLYVASDRIMMSKAEAYYEAEFSSAIYISINNTVKDKCAYDDLIHISRNNAGDITMITADSLKVNSLAKEISLKTTEYLSDFTSKGVGIPLGAFTGINMISGFGKRITMKLITVSSVKCEIVSKFEQAGINQTRQSLYLVVKPEVCIVTKFKTLRKNESIEVLVFDNLIIGKIPQFYAASSVIGSS